MTNSEIIEILTLFLMQYRKGGRENERYSNCEHILEPPIRQNYPEQFTMKCFHFPLSHSGMA